MKARIHGRALLTFIAAVSICTSFLLGGGTAINVNAQEVSEDKVHFIVLPDTQPGNAILIESAGHYGLVDAGNPSESSHPEFNYPNGSGKTAAAYLDKIGVEHLDFVLGTHSHSDHIGGVPDLAEAVNSEGGHFIDGSTAYIYKSYVRTHKDDVHGSDAEAQSGDYVGECGWYNEEYCREAVEAMQADGAKILDVSDPQSEGWQSIGAAYTADAANPAGATLSFPFGNGSVTLYNLIHASDRSENSNSIVTLFQAGGKKVLLTGDLDLYDGAETNVMKAVHEDAGTVDILQGGHHGFAKSTSKDTLDIIRPKHVVLSNADGRAGSEWKDTAYGGYLKKMGSDLYMTKEASTAIVCDLDDGSIETYAGDGLVPAKAWEGNPKGWARWYYTAKDFYYVYQEGNNDVAVGRVAIDGKTYTFDEDGILQGEGEPAENKKAGWVKDSSGWWYRNEDGTWPSNAWKEINGKWYWFESCGYMSAGKWVGSYYVDGSGAWVPDQWVKNNTGWWYRYGDGTWPASEWKQIGGTWYYFDGSGYMAHDRWIGNYYVKSSGAMAANEWIDGYWLSADGCWRYKPRASWKKNSRGWWYEDTSGWYPRNTTQTIDGKVYKFDSAGYLIG